MIIDIVTLFPQMFEGYLNSSVIKRALDNDLVKVNVINLRDYSKDKHHRVDDTPYGGGAGMVLRVEPVFDCLEAIKDDDSFVILMTPQGTTYQEKMAFDLSKKKHIILICGHYEGFDERIRSFVDLEISIGDFVLTGGEIPAMAISDSIIRLLDGVIERDSYMDDSFSNGLLEYPQYTKPQTFMDMEVPSVLINGNHKLIAEFRKKESLKRTYYRRPDLLDNYSFDDFERKVLKELEEEKNE